MAFGPLNLMPHEFWELTPGEFMDLCDGYKWRNEREWEKMAQLASWIMSPHLKKAVTAKKLLGKSNDKEATTPEKTRAVVSELMDEMGGGLTWQV